MAQAITSYTKKLEKEQSETLLGILRERGWKFREVPYASFAAEGPNVNVAMYESGKLVVQGKGTEEFVQFVLEPEVLGRAELGYEEILNPDMLIPRIGVDESGKGDLFGPLCVAGVYVNAGIAGEWKRSGVRDSKNVGSDKKIEELADLIRGTRGCVSDLVVIGNEAYNRMIGKMGSVNRVLAWGHARVIENLLKQRGRMDPAPVRAVIDQFASTERTVNQALMDEGKRLEIVQRHKAESDLAVAAASILARDAFVRKLGEIGKETGVRIPKGAGNEADKALRLLADQRDVSGLGRWVKMHFRNVNKVLGGGLGPADAQAPSERGQGGAEEGKRGFK